MKDELFKVTGVGSLPHHDIDKAIDHAFSFDIPYLPQLPMITPDEFMIYQALKGIQGLKQDKTGRCYIDRDEWQREVKFDFYPEEDYIAWKAFFERAKHEKVETVKVQICGAVTAYKNITWDNEEKIDDQEVRKQIIEVINQKVESIAHHCNKWNLKLIICFDEPSNIDDFAHLDEAYSEIKKTLSQFDYKLGIHSCGENNWDKIFNLGIDYLSFDSELSLKSILENNKLTQFLDADGILAVGIIPTNSDCDPIQPDHLFEVVIRKIIHIFSDEESISKILSHIILTPACGLAFKNEERTEEYQKSLRLIQRKFMSLVPEMEGHL